MHRNTLVIVIPIAVHLLHFLVTGDVCSAVRNCSDCIRQATACAWCRQPHFETNRCDTVANLLKKKCTSENIFNPTTLVVKSDSNMNFGTSKEGRIIQMRPQQVSLKLRPGQEYNFKIYIQQTKDYPVDLYYLMDLSKSMKDDKETVARLGDKLISEMQKLTSDFRIGFGSFVDKVVSPYVSLESQTALKEQCDDCEAPYGFRHAMPLSRDTSQFKQLVAKSKVSGYINGMKNVDAPEGGFDAIMQVVTCRSDIQWRNASRKLLLFSTDAAFHLAGDGKLGGIVSPNDGQCHVKGGIYTETLNQDYPSIGHIRSKVRRSDVNIIFAITRGQYELYRQLSAIIDGSSVGVLESDSSNIIDLVKSEYKRILSKIELVDDAPSDMNITYFSSCQKQKYKQTSKCENVSPGTTVEYDVKIQVHDCPKDPATWKRTVVIEPIAFDDQLTLNVELQCECDCDKEDRPEKCAKGLGELRCGTCQCIKGHALDSQKRDCYNQNDTVPCSGRGKCQCGICICDEKTSLGVPYGEFCECDDYNCPRRKGKVCFGETHGKCKCGMCLCTPGWTGLDCGCSTGTDACKSPTTGKLCTGRGECTCEKCKCNDSVLGVYTGENCENYPPPPEACKKLKTCVECFLSNQSCPCDHSPSSISLTKTLTMEDSDIPCVFIDSQDCTVQFKYKIIKVDDAIDAVVTVQEERYCSIVVNTKFIILCIVVIVLVAGVVCLVIWKILTTIYDAREYARFEKEVDKAKWNRSNNPLYKRPIATFENPMYGERSSPE